MRKVDMEEHEKEEKTILVATGVVQDGNKVLMSLRNEKENPGAHLMWEFPGGKVEFNETPEAALVREIKEETGYTVRIVDSRPVVWTNTWEYPRVLQHTVVLVFLCEAIGEQESAYDVKVKEVAWKSIDEIDYSKTLPGTKEMIDELIRSK